MIIKSKWMGWTGRVARKGLFYVYRILVGKSEVITRETKAQMGRFS